MTKEQIFDDLRGMVSEPHMKRLAQLFETVPEECKMKRRTLATETMTWAMAMIMDAFLRRPMSYLQQMEQLRMLNEECARYVDELMPELDRATCLEITEEMLRFICYIIFGCCGGIKGEWTVSTSTLRSRRFLICMENDPELGELYHINYMQRCVIDFGEEDFIVAYEKFCEKAGCHDETNARRKCFDLYPMDRDKERNLNRKKEGCIRWEEIFADEEDAAWYLNYVMGGLSDVTNRALPRMFKYRADDIEPFEGFFPNVEQDFEAAILAEKHRLIDTTCRIVCRDPESLPYYERQFKEFFRNDKEMCDEAIETLRNVLAHEEPAAPTSPDTPLAIYIKDREVRQKVISAVGTCKKNGQVAATVQQILKEHNMWNNDMISKPFSEALLTYLSYNTNKEALYQAFYRLDP